MTDCTEISFRAEPMPVAQVAEQLPALCKSLGDNPDAVIAITINGRPALALMPWESWLETEDLAAAMETLEIMADPKASAALLQAKADHAAGTAEYIPGEVAMQRLVDQGRLDPALLDSAQR